MYIPNCPSGNVSILHPLGENTIQLIHLSFSLDYLDWRVGQPTWRGRTTFSTSSADGSHRSCRLHVHWYECLTCPTQRSIIDHEFLNLSKKIMVFLLLINWRSISFGGVATSRSGWIVRPSGSFGAGRFRRRFQRCNHFKGSQRIGSSWILLPTGCPIATASELPSCFYRVTGGGGWAFNSIGFIGQTGRDCLSQSWRSAARQRRVARGRRQLPAGASDSARWSRHNNQPEPTAPTDVIAQQSGRSEEQHDADTTSDRIVIFFP